MRRSFERKANLSAFRCDLATLESFITDLTAEFSPDSPNISIKIDLPAGEDLQFDSFDEIKSFKALPASITTFSIRISSYTESNYRSIYLSKGSYKPYVNADSSSESWCAGIVEKTKRFAQNNRAWYWFIRPWIPYLLMILTTIFFLSSASRIIVSKQYDQMKTALEVVTLLILGGISGYLFLAYERVFSPTVLFIRSEEGWIRKHSTELTIGAATVAALAALYTALIK